MRDFDKVQSMAQNDSTLLHSRLPFYEKVSLTPLHFAATRDDPGMIDLLLELGAEANSEDENGRTPADLALNMGHKDAYGRLVENGAPVDPKLLEKVGDEDGAQRMSRLHQALVDGERETIEAVLDEDPTLVNTRLPDVWGTGGTYGAAALHWAAMFGHLGIAELLLERGADLELRDETYNGTPLGWAREYDRTEMERFLLERGATSARS